MKLLVDVARLEATGTITADQAVAIRRIAGAETTALAINVVTVLGVVAVVGGVVALNPDPVLIAGLGIVLAVAGFLVRLRKSDGIAFLGAALVFIGTLMHVSAVGTIAGDGPLALAYATVVFLIVGAILRNRFLVALAAVSTASLLGASTGYRHATYELGIDQPTLTIVVFTLLAIVSYALARRVPDRYADLPRVFGLLSVIWVNVAFWIGSLWGDDPGAGWTRDPAAAPGGFHIPDAVFAIVWAAALLGIGVLAAARHQRGLVNAVATFGAIHFYTQWFDRIGFEPWMVIAAGVLAVAIASLLWRYNQSRARLAR
jgi:hypothetical protein